MDRERIMKVLAHPEFDARDWFMDAMTDYLSSNAHAIFAQYPEARPILLQAMESSDIAQIFKRSWKDAKGNRAELVQLLQTFLRDQHPTLRQEALKAAIEENISSFFDLALETPLVFSQYEYPRPFFSIATSSQLNQAFIDWRFTANFHQLDEVFKRLNPDDCLPIFSDESLENIISGLKHHGSSSLDDYRSALSKHAATRGHGSTPKRPTPPAGQIVLVFSLLISRIQSISTAIQLKRRIPEANIRKLHPKWDKSNEVTRATLQLKGLNKLCQCGHVATSSPGLTLHAKSCETARVSPNLMVLIEERIARLS